MQHIFLEFLASLAAHLRLPKLEGPCGSIAAFNVDGNAVKEIYAVSRHSSVDESVISLAQQKRLIGAS